MLDALWCAMARGVSQYLPQRDLVMFDALWCAMARGVSQYLPQRDLVMLDALWCAMARGVSTEPTTAWLGDVRRTLMRLWPWASVQNLPQRDLVMLDALWCAMALGVSTEPTTAWLGDVWRTLMRYGPGRQYRTYHSVTWWCLTHSDALWPGASVQNLPQRDLVMLDALWCAMARGVSQYLPQRDLVMLDALWCAMARGVSTEPTTAWLGDVRRTLMRYGPGRQYRTYHSVTWWC